MKPLVPCSDCSLAGINVPCGFATNPTLVCTQRGNTEVEPDDGCTMGEPGEPQQVVEQYDVDLSVTYNPMYWEVD